MQISYLNFDTLSLDTWNHQNILQIQCKFNNLPQPEGGFLTQANVLGLTYGVAVLQTVPVFFPLLHV